MCQLVNLSEGLFGITWRHVTLCWVVFFLFLNRFWSLSVHRQSELISPSEAKFLPHRRTDSHHPIKLSKSATYQKKEKKKKDIVWNLAMTATSAMISHPAHHLSCQSINLKKCKCLKSMAYKFHITSPFRCCMNTYTPQNNVCVLLDGCFSPFVISNKHINRCGKRISSHLMADQTIWNTFPVSTYDLFYRIMYQQLF